MIHRCCYDSPTFKIWKIWKWRSGIRQGSLSILTTWISECGRKWSSATCTSVLEKLFSCKFW
jgi:hypothetical protein